MKAGATQNETTSASESNSTPNWVVVRVRRATLPSRMSSTMPTKTATGASTKRNWAESTMARKPQKRLAVVSRLGSRKMPRRGCSRNSCQRRRRGSRASARLDRLAVTACPPGQVCPTLPQHAHDRLAAPDLVPYRDPDLGLARDHEVR